jgi:hypothetical protein
MQKEAGYFPASFYFVSILTTLCTQVHSYQNPSTGS